MKAGDKVAIYGYVDTVEEEDGKTWVRIKLPGQPFLEFDADDLELVESE